MSTPPRRVPVVKLHPDVLIPSRATFDAAGMDVHAYLPDFPVVIDPGERALIPTGLSCAIPSGWEIQVRPRSGMAYNHGVTVLNSPGTIDADYRGELKVLLLNTGDQSYVVSHEARIAQLVLSPIHFWEFEETYTLDDTARSTGGFGSTGSGALT